MHFHELFGHFTLYTTSGLVQGAIYALFALGYTLVYGVLRLINFAHSEVFMIGTFAAIETWGALGLTGGSKIPAFGPMVGFLLIGLVAAVLASGATALVVELAAYRPLRRRNAPPLAFLITAIGASLVIQQLVAVRTQFNLRGAPTLIKPTVVFTLFSTPIYATYILIIALALVMMFLLDRFINKSRLGRGIRAVAQNPDSAALMGVNKDRIISLVFLLGGLMAGIAAVMYILKVGATRYDTGFEIGIQAFAAAVLGGIGNLRGALLGGIVLGIVESWGAAVFGSQWQYAFGCVVLIAILMFRPTGLLGESLGRARA
jgi:branched-chain amino acid transport system permease protein